MDTRINVDIEPINHRTCQAICDAIGERLQQNLRPDSEPSPRLQRLMEELRRRDREPH
jgi:hypothetical protein